jgi:chromate transporter
MGQRTVGTVVQVPTASRNSLRELVPPFLRLGLTAFGGPAAHIAMMEEEFVRRRQWISHDQFLDMLGASNLVPGPSSTEVAIHIGHHRAGWRGLIAAGTCFIIPSMLIVMAFAFAYAKFGSFPEVQNVMRGIKPIIIAVILQALWRLAGTAVKDVFFAIIGLIATALALTGVNLLLILLAAGIATMLRALSSHRSAVSAMVTITLATRSMAPSTLAIGGKVPASLSAVFLVFLKFGAVIFGSGYVLLAFLQSDLVGRLHWLTQAQLLDAVAVGQFTPGPVFTTATFIGYLLGGVGGAVAATVGIFLPGFLLVAASRPLIPRIRRSEVAGAFLDGINIGAVALMFAVTWQLGRAALVDAATVGIGVISAFALVRFRVNSAWLILAGAAVGEIASRWPAP